MSERTTQKIITEEQKMKVYEAVKSKGGDIADILDVYPISVEIKSSVENVQTALDELVSEKKLAKVRSGSCSEVTYYCLPDSSFNKLFGKQD